MNNQVNRSSLNSKKPNRSSFSSGYSARDEDDDIGSSNSVSSSGGSIGDFYKMFEDTIKDVTSNVGNVRELATNLLKEHPFYAILGAAAVGFAAGTALRGGVSAVSRH